MKQLNSKKTRYPRFDKIVVIQPMQRCTVRVTNDNSAERMGPDTIILYFHEYVNLIYMCVTHTSKRI